jgi:hypothetical protein
VCDEEQSFLECGVDKFRPKSTRQCGRRFEWFAGDRVCFEYEHVFSPRTATAQLRPSAATESSAASPARSGETRDVPKAAEFARFEEHSGRETNRIQVRGQSQ